MTGEMTLEQMAAAVHERIWSMYVHPACDFLLDYTGPDVSVSLPTPEECSQGFINPLGWWTPIENGAFFTGVYLTALCDLYERRGLYGPEAGRLATGLMRLGCVGRTKGFIARGVAGDGISHYAMGSDDQTGPWFHGLWRYLCTDLPDDGEKKRIGLKMTEVAEALLENGWKMPCDGTGENRGDWNENLYRNSARLLFVCKIMERITGAGKWKSLYIRYLNEQPGKSGLSRLDICTLGMEHDFLREPALTRELWIYLDTQNCIRELIRLEDDRDIAAAYSRGLRSNAKTVLTAIPAYLEFDRDHGLPFLLDWRKLGDHFKQDLNVTQAVDMASRQFQMHESGCLRAKKYENRFMREPLCACYLALSAMESGGERRALQQLALSCVRQYPYEKLYSAVFFLVESIFAVY